MSSGREPLVYVHPGLRTTLMKMVRREAIIYHYTLIFEVGPPTKITTKMFTCILPIIAPQDVDHLLYYNLHSTLLHIFTGGHEHRRIHHKP